jgi:prevent-host-death family protein
MPIIGVRELREQTADVLRKVREERAEYIVTHQGRPVAMLLPVAVEAVEQAMLRAGRDALAASWHTYASLADSIRAAWPKGRTTQDVLNELRR